MTPQLLAASGVRYADTLRTPPSHFEWTDATADHLGYSNLTPYALLTANIRMSMFTYNGVHS